MVKRLLQMSLLLLLGLNTNVMGSRIQPPGSGGVSISNLMSVSEFRRCGLDKLSSEELASLDSWLQQYTTRLLATFSKLSDAKTPDIVESQIDGDFEGWDGETVFKLTNGQIWQQSSYAYHYSYSYMPEVLIYRTSGGYKMKVEDEDETIYVRRLK